MKKKLPFEDAIESKLQQLPLPDKEQSWQAMNALLEKEKKRRGMVWYVKRMAPLGLLLLGMAGIWLMLHDKQDSNQMKDADNRAWHTDKRPEPVSANGGVAEADIAVAKEAGTTQSAVVETGNKDVVEKAAVTAMTAVPVYSRRKPVVNKKNEKGSVTANLSAPGIGEDITGSRQVAVLPGKDDAIGVSVSSDVSSKENAVLQTGNEGAGKISNTGEAAEDSSAEALAGNKPVAEKPVQKEAVALQRDTAKTATAGVKKTVPKQSLSKYRWSGGVGLQQQIPVGGQQVSPYGYNGSRSVVQNYIPSVYIRLQRNNKWFVRAEFSYGAPRNVPLFEYNRVTKAGSAGSEITSTTLSLKKTYYHEFPVSFNHFIKKGWSIGAGLNYGLLHRVISEKKVATTNLVNGQQTTLDNIIPAGFTDSFFYRSQWQWLVQSEYEWKRFSAGIRYAADIFPYIKYTLPDGNIQQRRNNMLGVFIRARLF